jgi:hypothetical protein
MGIGFHGTTESLLRDLGERVHVINDHPAIDIRFGCHLTNEQTHLSTNGLNASVLFGSQEKTLVCGLMSPAIRM